ncbi:MAG: NAD-dependent epimerase/dehydratase family protein [Chloroflexota bacterium]|nr:NAD-dependent epimerase/dehydratase family protein [Chloroflexota bacterium]
MRCFVTGCAGFIGSNLVDRLLASGNEVIGYDNFSTGQREFLREAAACPHFTLIEGDTLDDAKLRHAMERADVVFHLAANADVRFGTHHPRKDLEQNTIATFNVLEAMRANGANRIVFASTGSVYGEPDVFPTPETCPFPIQTSLYAASKVACEGMISAYCTGFGLKALIFRFVSILGERYTHGHVFDFYEKLRENPHSIEILGDGRQKKSYLYVQDCIDAMLLSLERTHDRVSIYNLGTDEYCAVDDSLSWICTELGVDPERRYTGGQRGWVGDSPFIFLDCSRMRALGWKPNLSVRSAVLRTLNYLRANDWLLSRG